VIFVFGQVLVFAQEGAIIEGQPTETRYFSTVPEIPIFSTAEPTFTPFYSYNEGSSYEQGNELPIIEPTSQPAFSWCSQGTNVVQNGNFSSPTSSPWNIYSTPTASNIESQYTGGQFQFRRIGGNSAVLLQYMNCITPRRYGFTINLKMSGRDSGLRSLLTTTTSVIKLRVPFISPVH